MSKASARPILHTMLNDDVLPIIVSKGCERDEVAALAQIFPMCDLGIKDQTVLDCMRKFPIGGIPVCGSCVALQIELCVDMLVDRFADPDPEYSDAWVVLEARFVSLISESLRSENVFAENKLVRGMLNVLVGWMFRHLVKAGHTVRSDACIICCNPRLTEACHVKLRAEDLAPFIGVFPQYLLSSGYSTAPGDASSIVDAISATTDLSAVAREIMTGRDITFACEICGDQHYDQEDCKWAFQTKFPDAEERVFETQSFVRLYTDRIEDVMEIHTKIPECRETTCLCQIDRLSRCNRCRKCCLSPTCSFHAPPDSKCWSPPMRFLKLLSR